MGTGTADEKVHELMKQYKRWTKGKLLERLRVLEKQRVSDEMSSKEKAEARQKECARLFYLRKRIREGSFTLFLKEQWLETREANPRLWGRKNRRWWWRVSSQTSARTCAGVWR